MVQFYHGIPWYFFIRECTHFPGLFSLWGGVEVPPLTHPPTHLYTHTKQNVHTHLQNPGYAAERTAVVWHTFLELFPYTNNLHIVSRLFVCHRQNKSVYFSICLSGNSFVFPMNTTNLKELMFTNLVRKCYGY